jgi:hypothetical protein
MRLYDKLIAQRGGYLDHVLQGGITKIYPDLSQAQCFIISPEIATACAEVLQSKPSSLLSAMDMLRTPYRHTWVEWTDRSYTRTNNKAIPRQLGMLLVTDESCRNGWAALAWEHADRSLMLNPLGLAFSWERGKIAIEVYAKEHLVPNAVLIAAERRKWLADASLPDNWKRFSDKPAEREAAREREAALELDLRASVIPIEACLLLNVWPGTARYESYVDDLAGELQFIESFLLLLNSRNTIIAQERDDFRRLNRARAKHKKPPLKEFITTILRIGRVQGNRALAAGHTRETARLHLVRGHFKMRASGVYWYSPHARGKGSDALKRAYEVR